MAKLVETTMTIKLSRLIRDSEEGKPFIDESTIAQLEEVISELVNDPSVLIEIN